MTVEAKQARELEAARRRHLDTCTKWAHQCPICLPQALHEMSLIHAGKGQRASDHAKVPQ